MQVFELHRPDEIVELAADPHRCDECGAVAFGIRDAALPVFRNRLRSWMPVKDEDQPGVMDRQRGVGSHLA